MLNPVDISVDERPQPMVAQPIHIRGGKSFEVTVAGIWQMIYRAHVGEL